MKRFIPFLFFAALCFAQGPTVPVSSGGGGGGGGASAQSELADVTLTDPADGECFIFDGTAGKWEIFWGEERGVAG